MNAGGLSCRTGRLRGARSLRDLYTLSCEMDCVGLALLGLLIPTSGRTDADHLLKSGIRVTK